MKPGIAYLILGGSLHFQASGRKLLKQHGGRISAQLTGHLIATQMDLAPNQIGASFLSLLPFFA